MTTTSYWQRFERNRISRRRLIAATGVGVAGAAFIAACGGGGGGGDDDSSSEDLGPPVRGGRYQIGTAVNIDTLDPHLSIAGGVAYFPRIYNTLIAQSPIDTSFTFEDLADKLEQPDESTWIFNIRPGVKIAPNTMDVPERDLDAEDAFVSFDRIQNLDQANAAVFVNDWFESHVASDNNTIYTVTTPTPYAWFLFRLGFFINMIAPKELILNDPDRMTDAAVGGGPFSVAPGDYSEGQSLILNRNPNYYRTDPNNDDAPLPYVDGMDVLIIPDRSARVAAFRSQQTHTYGPENQDEADGLLAGLEVYQGSSDPVFTFISFTMNVERPPWDNPLVRKAAMHAINRAQYIDLVYKGDAQANGLVHWPVGAYALEPDELEELQGWDVEKSKALIQEAGFELPLKVKVMFAANSTIEEHNTHLPIFIEQMAAAGFEVEQDGQEFGTWLDNYTNINYDASLALNQIYETPEIPLDFHHSRGPAGDEIFSGGLKDDAIDAAIDATKTITNPDELIQAIHDVQRQIYEVGPMFLPIVSPFSRTLFWNFVKNIPSGLGSVGLLLNDWWVDEEGA